MLIGTKSFPLRPDEPNLRSRVGATDIYFSADVETMSDSRTLFDIVFRVGFALDHSMVLILGALKIMIGFSIEN